jgi:hypothetical protein
MGTPVDITSLRRWEAYGQSPSWPGSPDALFIVAAGARVLRAKFGIEPEDVAHDPDSEGYRSEIAHSMAALLTSGSLLATARRVDGSRQEPVAPTEWTPVTAYEAVATGIVRRDHGRRRGVPHWVFVGLRETDILATLYQATDMLHAPEDAGPTEAVGETVLAAVSAMARNPAAIVADDLSSAPIRLLQPHLVRTLHPDDRDTMVAASVPWLLDRFGDATTGRYDYHDFEKAAVAQFAPLMTGRIFEKVWSGARDQVQAARTGLRKLELERAARMVAGAQETPAKQDERKRAEKLAAHAARFKSGPNAKAAAAR